MAAQRLVELAVMTIHSHPELVELGSATCVGLDFLVRIDFRASRPPPWPSRTRQKTLMAVQMPS
jgi:hypothetical protein